jgi:DNA-binding response OmpR family regulator
MSRVLVVEDDAAILQGLADNLECEGYQVLTAADGEAGYLQVREKSPDLIILDLMMPKLSGYELCRRLRDEGLDTPILMLTARGQEEDRVLGLDLGADDYVSKPFSVRELMARVRALLRRSAPQQELPAELRFGDVCVDFHRYDARKGGEPLAMSPKEFGLLRHLVAEGGKVVSRDELLDAVWGYGATPTTRTVDNHVASLRAKLEDDPLAPKRLITVHGVGYRWDSCEQTVS